MPEKQIKLFSLSTCGHCKSCVKLLESRSLLFDNVEVDILGKKDRKEVIKEIKKLNPKCSFPTIVVGEKIIVGFREDEIKEALEAL